jgi:hypothetical protein
VTGAFAVGQAAVALFGDESEELQKVLLRVNAAMAALQGLQQLQTVFQKESTAAQLANVIVTKAQTVAQTVFNFVVGTSTGLLKAFRIALATTGVGLLVIGVIELFKALQSTNNELERATGLIENQKEAYELLNETIDQRVSIEEARLRLIGAAESEILKIQGRALVQRANFLSEENKNLALQRDSLENGTQAWIKYNEQIIANNEILTGLKTDIQVKNLQLQKQLVDEAAEAEKKRAEEAKKAAEEAKRIAKERRAAEFDDFKASLERQILAAQEGSEEQLAIKKRLLLATLQIDLENEKLTINQRKFLIEQFYKDRINLDKNFFAERSKFLLEQVASDIQAELQGLELSSERRLELNETAIRLQAEIEIEAANGNAAKIAEITAKRDKAIRDTRIASIRETLDYELQVADVGNAATVRALNRRLDDEKTNLTDRIRIIDELASYESDAIKKRIDALNKERQQKLISEKDYNLQYSKLLDDQAKLQEDTEAKKTDVTKKASEERKRITKEEIQTILEIAGQIVDILDTVYQLQADKENAALEKQKQTLKELRDAGAITEKEAQVRQKRIEADERRIRQQQAQRDKQLAVFKALLAIPQAVLQGLQQGGPVLAAIYGALAAAQAALVIARPIPKFGKGKKNSYEGLAEVGETGAEIIEHNGRMYVADKPQVVWLSKQDKVFNPQETEKMLTKPAMNTERASVSIPKKQFQIDYKKLGKEVGKHTSTTVYVDGYREQVLRKESFLKELNKRRSW